MFAGKLNTIMQKRNLPVETHHDLIFIWPRSMLQLTSAYKGAANHFLAVNEFIFCFSKSWESNSPHMLHADIAAWEGNAEK
ncbi:MAG TPA: hypothetical protein VFR24_09970 [Candidatus Angelobacter sp.]|jgi:hypothetical protein|nr:hypothetical protein [Candidatus Angelobacter sp.]